MKDVQTSGEICNPAERSLYRDSTYFFETFLGFLLFWYLFSFQWPNWIRTRYPYTVGLKYEFIKIMDVVLLKYTSAANITHCHVKLFGNIKKGKVLNFRS
jgi:hypothetical protein